MGDAYGPLPLPALAWTDGTTLADPAIDTLLAFFTALLNDLGAAAWSSVDPYAGGKAVVTSKNFDPRRGGFNEAWCPALFLHRMKAYPSEWLAADYFVRRSVLELLWIPPSAVQERRAIQTPFLNLIASAVDSVLEPEARTPGWVMSGDPDPRTPGRGSLLWTYLGPLVFRLDQYEACEPATLSIKMSDNSRKDYAGVRLLLELREQSSQGLDDSDFDPFAGITQTMAGGSDGTFPGPSQNLYATIASVSPSTGPHAGGTAIAIQGVLFTPGVTVTIGGVACTGVTLTGSGLITAVTPAGIIGAQPLVVTDPSGDTASSTFTFT